MRTTLLLYTVALCLGFRLHPALLAATPDQAYHRTPACVDGNCVPNRATNGYHATRWRPWPGGEPSQNKSVPPVGIELKNIQAPPRDKELEMPVRPAAPGDATVPSPNDQPGGGIVLPPELQNVTPPKPVEQMLPGNSSLPRGPLFPGFQPGPAPQPLLLGKMPEPLRSASPAPPPREIPATEPPLLRIRPAGNSQPGLMPEMVPWSDEDKNPAIRQAARLNGKQVHHTINLDEAALPNANENQIRTIRVIHESSPAPSKLTSAISMISAESRTANQPLTDSVAKETAWRSPAANAPAILPAVEAQPLLPTANLEPQSGNTAVSSPLRGLSQGNPLRR